MISLDFYTIISHNIQHDISHPQRTEMETPTQNAPETTKAATSFMHLPAELRNMIYEFALLEQDSVDICAAEEPPALLSTSLAISREATPIYYGANTFDAPYQPDAARWLRTLSKRARSLLQSVRLVAESADFMRMGYSDMTRSAWWFGHVRRMLKRMQNRRAREGLKKGVVRMPLLVHEQGEVHWGYKNGAGQIIWVSLADLQHYEVHRQGFTTNGIEKTWVVRKEMAV